ncbi:MAG TPA: protein-glutamine glutaminase family protein [Dermatophilaceae bacterium]|nr:protein-glutamine glutaminase family protein [Dermatophilaceae bacterium]
MLGPNAIVSTTIRFEPPFEGAPEEQLRSAAGLSVQLEGERRVRLDADDIRSAGFARVLDQLSKQQMPVYLEVDPETDFVTRLLIPHVARVAAITSGGGTLDVELDRSHAPHSVWREDPDGAELERRLRESQAVGGLVILTEDEAHHVIDVRAFTPPSDWPMPPFPPVLFPEPTFLPRFPWPLSRIPWLLERLWYLVRWPWWWWFHCLTPARAQQVFTAMAGTTCNPLTVPPPCIPFLYPDDGCWARAHEMCRLMINMGHSPRKVWIDHSNGLWLQVKTKNNPNCYVEWGWHVAPTLHVRGPNFWQTQRMVIDPSLFTTPVSFATWKGVQGDPAATLTDTVADQFWHGGGTDPTYSASNQILAQYRLALQNRSNQFGPPPYANCP